MFLTFIAIFAAAMMSLSLTLLRPVRTPARQVALAQGRRGLTTRR